MRSSLHIGHERIASLETGVRFRCSGFASSRINPSRSGILRGPDAAWEPAHTYRDHFDLDSVPRGDREIMLSNIEARPPLAFRYASLDVVTGNAQWHDYH